MAGGVKAMSMPCACCINIWGTVLTERIGQAYAWGVTNAERRQELYMPTANAVTVVPIQFLLFGETLETLPADTLIYVEDGLATWGPLNIRLEPNAYILL